MWKKVKRLLCMWQHDWVTTKNIRTAAQMSNGDTTYIYERKCSREGCGVHQEISITHLVGLARFSSLEREWVS